MDGGTDGQMDDRQQSIRKAHLSFQRSVMPSLVEIGQVVLKKILKSTMLSRFIAIIFFGKGGDFSFILTFYPKLQSTQFDWQSCCGEEVKNVKRFKTEI